MSKYFTNYEKEKAPLDGKGFEKGTDNHSKSYQSTKSIANRHKKRNWAFVVYPESAPENWIEILQKTGLQVAISPLHDKDLDPDGKEKKAHWHVIAVYNGPTSFNVVKTLTDKLNAPIPIALEAVRGYYRYFTHADNPDKHQYDEKEIQTLNGFSILDYAELGSGETQKIKKELHLLIMKRDFLEYSDFMDFLLFEATEDEYFVGCSNTYFFDKYISSRRNARKK